MNPDIVIKGIKGTGLLVSAIFGGVAGFMYQNWVTQADLHVDYTLAKYEESYALPSGIANQLRGRADVVDYGEAMVVWPFKQALNFNSWQRYELEDLLKLLEPLERESDSDVSDLEAIKTLVGGHPTCDAILGAFLSRRTILTGATPSELFQQCSENPAKTVAGMKLAAKAGLADGQLFRDTLKNLRDFLQVELRKTTAQGPMVIDVGITNSGHTEGVVNNRPVLRVQEPESFEVMLRIHERPRPWERAPMANYVSVPIPTPGQPVISVRGQSFVSLTLEPDKLMNSPEILQKLDGYFGKAAAKAKIVFLDTERQSALSSRTFILKPAI